MLPGYTHINIVPIVESAYRMGKIIKPIANHYTSYTKYLVWIFDFLAILSGALWFVFVFVCSFGFDYLCPSQQFFSYVGTGLPGLTGTKQRITYLAQGHSAVPPARLEPTTHLVYVIVL